MSGPALLSLLSGPTLLSVCCNLSALGAIVQQAFGIIVCSVQVPSNCFVGCENRFSTYLVTIAVFLACRCSFRINCHGAISMAIAHGYCTVKTPPIDNLTISSYPASFFLNLQWSSCYLRITHILHMSSIHSSQPLLCTYCRPWPATLANGKHARLNIHKRFQVILNSIISIFYSLARSFQLQCPPVALPAAAVYARTAPSYLACTVTCTILQRV